MTGTSNSGIKLSLCILLGILTSEPARSGNKFLSFEQAFERTEPRVFEELPKVQTWVDDDHYLVWKPSDEDKNTQLIRVNAGNGARELFVDFSDLNMRFSKGSYGVPWSDCSKDFRRFVIESEDDLYLYIPADDIVKRLTDTESEEKNPRLAPDGRKIAFTRSGNLFWMDLDSGMETQITIDGGETIYNGWASWVYYEEVLGRSSNYAAFWWAPNSDMIAFMKFDDTNVPEYPIFHCEGSDSYLEMQRYPKPGEINPSVQLGVYHLPTGKIIWMNTDPEADQYVAWPFWSPDSKYLFYQWMNRDQNRLEIRRADPSNGKEQLIYEEKQAEWVEFFEDLHILAGDAGLILRSDKSGWRHLYHQDLGGKPVRRITAGSWDVEEIVKIDERNNTVYFIGSQEDKTSKYLYRVGLDGKDLTKLTAEPGTHQIMMSDRSKYYIDNFNSILQPGLLSLYDNQNRLIRILGQKGSETTDDYVLARKELFSITTDDNLQLPASWVLPAGFDRTKKYPVIFKVYGGPGRASVSNQYPSLADLYYAQNDIITVQVDHRGSQYFGKKGAVQMHRSLGKWEIDDLIQAVKWLGELPFIDTKRIGIVGGSYGGYVACLALTYGGEYFTHGIAKYSVTDWRFYDSIYTERYMDQPKDNPDGYLKGSVLSYTDKYRGHLLITHGALDDNVHMQNTTEFVQDLQKLNKKFEMQIYPNQRHGIRGRWRPHALKAEVSFWFRHFLEKDLEQEEN